ncbi:MAG: response regulator [Bacteroidetes bacterium]|nr:response regulator [Bacteroidota bacterium]
MNRKLHSILLVEDNFMTNTYNEKILEDICIANHIITAEDGNDALDYLERCKKNNTYPEIMIIDLNLPDMSGWEILDHFSALHFEKGKSPAIIILTVSHREEDERRAFSVPGVIGYLTKPMTKQHFLDALDIYEQHYAHHIT